MILDNALEGAGNICYSRSMGQRSILIIDNYDSFTGNLHHLLVQTRPSRRFTILRNGNPSIFEGNWEGLVISPGPGGPGDTGFLRKFFEEAALPRRLPVLGICLGMQFLAWYYGLTVSPSEDARHGRRVTIEMKDEDLFKGIASPTRAVRYNSLAIEESVEEVETRSPLRVTAWQRKSGMIMAVRHRSLPISAVQFHPESFLAEHSQAMIDNFFKAHLDD